MWKMRRFKAEIFLDCLVAISVLAFIMVPSVVEAQKTHVPASRLQTGLLSGTIFSDKNFNGVKDPQEGGVQGCKIFLAGISPDSTMSDSTGMYHFAGLSP